MVGTATFFLKRKMYQYVDPHNEGTFVASGNRYYLSQLYGKPIGILKPIRFTPIGTYKNNAQAFTSSTGFTQKVYSSGHVDGKIVLLFDVPGVKPEALQYYCFLDVDAMAFPPGMQSKEKVDMHDYELNQKIIEQKYYSDLDFFGKLMYHLKPVLIPAAIVGSIWAYNKLKK